MIDMQETQNKRCFKTGTAFLRALRGKALFLVLLGFAGPVLAVEMSGGVSRDTRNNINAGGGYQSGTGYQMVASIAGMDMSALSGGSYTLGPGLPKIYSYPTTVTDLQPAPNAGGDSTTLDVTWTAPAAEISSSLSATSYKIRHSPNPISTQADFEAATDVSQAWTPVSPGAAESRQITGLAPNTTYYVGLESRDSDKNSSYLSNGGVTVTHAQAPGAFTFTQVSTDTLSVSWNGGANPSDTQYSVDIDSDTLFSPFVASTGWTAFGVTSHTFTNLSPNVLYYVKVQARNRNNVPTVAVQISTLTVGVEPIITEFSSMDFDRITVSWVGNNPAGTEYQAQASLDPAFGSVDFQSERTADLFSSPFTGLSINTTYYFRAVAFGQTDVSTSAVVSTMTLVHPVASGTIDDVYQSSAAFSWTDSPFNPAGLSYRVDIATNALYAGNVQSAFFRGGPSGGTVTGLLPNTVYWARVWSLNGIDQAAATPFKFNGGASFATAPVPPDSGGFVSVASTQVLVNVSEGAAPDNNTPIVYRVAASTVSSAAADLDAGTAGTFTFVSTHTYPFNMTLSGLAANTTYYMGVQVRGQSGLGSDYLVYGATVTKPALPVSPAYIVSASAITLSWSPNSNGLSTRYRAQAATGNYPDLGGTLAASTETYSTAFSFAGLSTNTTYYFDVTVLGNGGWPDQGPLRASTATLAEVPSAASPAFPAVFVTSATVVWAHGENPPADTRYVVEASSAGFAAGTFVHSATVGPNVAQHTFSSPALSPNADYSFRVAALNVAGLKTAYLAIGSTSTLAMTPSISGFTVNPTSITVQWSGNGNPADTAYYAENITPSVNHTAPSTMGTSWTDTGLLPNTTQEFRVRAVNRGGQFTPYSVAVTTWTAAVTPPAPLVDAVSKAALQVTFAPGSNPTAAPSRTQFAIQTISAIDSLGNQTADAGKFLKTNVSSNIFSLDGAANNFNDAGIWREFSAWDPNGIVIATGLASGLTYSFVVYARNGDAGSPPAVRTLASPSTDGITGSGAPRIALGAHFAGDGHSEHWVNTAVVSFTALGSYHYHYRFGKVSTSATSSDPGWNGKLDSSPAADVANDGTEHNPSDSLPVAGFKADSEGIWYLNVHGDDFLGSGGHGTPFAATPFALGVDLAAPVIPDLRAQFDSDDDTAILSGVDTPRRHAYFQWNEPSNGTPGAISPIVGYTTSFSADPAVTPVMSQSDPSFTTVRAATIPDQPYGTYYFKVRALDTAGNWTEPPAQFVYSSKPDAVRPRAQVVFGVSVRIPNTAINISVDRRPTIAVTFSEAVNQNLLQKSNSLTITAVRDNRGRTVRKDYPVTIVYDAASYTARVTPVDPLPLGYRYELLAGENVVDLGGNALADQLDQAFYTLMDPGETNTVLSEDGKTRIDFEPGSWGTVLASPAINEDPIRAPMAAAAISNIIEEANLNAQRNLGAFAQPISIKELNLYDGAGNRVQGSFNTPVTLTVSYPDADNDGVVDASNPPIREDAVRLCWLDEDTGVWVQVPGEAVDTVNNTITVPLHHFSVYGIIGAPSLNLANAYAYPVPFKPSQGHKQISFTNLSSVGTIKIYSLSGELVRQLDETDGDGVLKWDVTNSEGQPLASGVYFYLIENSQQKKRGKLMIVK